MGWAEAMGFSRLLNEVGHRSLYTHGRSAGAVPLEASGRFGGVVGATVAALAYGGSGEDGAIVEFELDGQRMTAFDGGPMLQFSPAVSFVVSCESQEEINHYWYCLLTGGVEEQCGWLKDPHGLSWQIVPAELSELMGAAPGPVMDALLKMRKIEIEPLGHVTEQAGHANED